MCGWGFLDLVAVEKVRREQNNHRGLVLRFMRNHEGEMLTAAHSMGHGCIDIYWPKRMPVPRAASAALSQRNLDILHSPPDHIF